MPGDDTPRPAATVIVIRDRDGGGFETLMVLRNLKSDFVGGAYVFPGGAVDTSDSESPLLGRCHGIDDVTASTILGVESGGLSYYVACVRELFEEAGLLLAMARDGSGLDGTRLEEHRRALNDGGASLLSVLESDDLELDVGALHYFAHWITPIGQPRRYDTRFFVAVAPAGQVPLHDDRELVGHTWVSPAEALERHRTGDMQLILPTIKNLEAVGRFASTSALLEAIMRDHDVPTIQPRIVPEGNGVRILLPGDPGYGDDAVGAADARGSQRT